MDLPGYLETPRNDQNEGEFLATAIETLVTGNPPIVVSPSASGAYSLPVLMNRPELMCGFVPVAPVSTNKYSMERYETVDVPTLIIYGENDKSLGLKSAKDLIHIPTASKPQVRQFFVW